jgi:PLP dependent protein
MEQSERIDELRANIASIRARIDAAAERAGRDPARVRLVAVSKTHPPELLRAAVAAGVLDFGENRVQEADSKVEALKELSDLRWHLIGHLQRNKVRRAVAIFDIVHSLDSVRLAQSLDRVIGEGAAGARERLAVLLQINIAGEAQKEGFDLAGGLSNSARLDDFLEDVAQIVELRHLEIRGLMTIAPYAADPEDVRPIFRGLRELRDELARRLPDVTWDDLSMGMTGDFEVAVEEGATLVRVGRAIFGQRA